LPVQVTPGLQQMPIMAAQAPLSVHLMLVAAAVVSNSVPQDWMPPQATLQVAGSSRHLTTLQLCPAGQPISQFVARQTMLEMEQELRPAQSMLHELPAQSIPP
jgi:hypothetical protein